MIQTTLKKILIKKKKWIENQKIKKPIQYLQKKISIKTRSFIKSLNKNKISFILECKKSSPSLGIINKNFNLNEISSVYKKYADVISVITENHYFHGNIENISIVRNQVSQPILCKDFIFDPYQIYLARYYQADAVLLMLSVLNDNEYIFLSNLCKNMNLGILTEVHNIQELKRAIYLKAQVIGINNRNLKNLSIDINNTYNLAPLIHKKAIIISESGFYKNFQLRKLSSIVNGFLIGSSLMKKKNLSIAVKKIIFGNNKICGLTRIKDAKISEKYGAIYGGLIFCKNSPRKINFKKAEKITSIKNLKFVGVFQNQNISEIIKKVSLLNLKTIQLHGTENEEYIQTLIKHLGYKIKIWKSIGVNKNIYFYQKFLNVNKYLFDNINPGSGKSFNWKILKNENLKEIILSGGLNLTNVQKALQSNFFGLDFNSGLEKSIGIKDKHKIKKIFKIIRNYIIRKKK
ncbi:bifunctional indole-3-glycerol-phosphate synthase TrpC/phosphoribosylanthranilate isomerase TrpF [Buchnera aphidicola]|uniref:bifunctional indole-3-glycerol-phosphate synthase TrpC/phosphoribosylanthranilate isomerase TrpF n=1 Tax=Buchnera aphidicola TaxID=9 RepID=UPI002237364A|nr:bifunctional indole-3-glycerol-phosphate synthase TrpC/phosphoribosylanthranilate isomerase TrpF [Buchnera aphidicola]MCW5197689.1 bifunctional indole-3-glycerol-phosphate synthase TrpC/phosphoribosylanthranilate isomerase TrpF [Buchnera aphidicola (Chaitophorus viminalis)]